MSLDDRIGSSRSRLDDVAYDLAAGDFVRYRPDDHDDTVAGVVRTVAAEGWDGCTSSAPGSRPSRPRRCGSSPSGARCWVADSPR